MERCKSHGAAVDDKGFCATTNVLLEVSDERKRQAALHGLNLENESGTGPMVRWARPLESVTHLGARGLEYALRIAYEEKTQVTWLDILLEEFSEVAVETDPEKLREELIQVAAVAVSWAEKLRDPEAVARSGGPSIRSSAS